MLKEKLAKLVRENPSVTTVCTPHTEIYFPGGIRPIKTSMDQLILQDKESAAYTKIYLPDFAICFIRSNQIVLF